MSDPRLAAPTTDPDEKVAGPASYFPSIERKYGKPIQWWIDEAARLLESSRHMEAVEALKSQHGLGHGHANAVVAWVRGRLSA